MDRRLWWVTESASELRKASAFEPGTALAIYFPGRQQELLSCDVCLSAESR